MTVSRGVRGRIVGVAGAALALSAALGGTAFAAEVGSGGGGGGGGGGAAACNPVSSLTAKGDPRVGETGLASIAVSYGVKPCVKGQSVIVDTIVYETAAPANVAYDNPDAPLNGKFTAFGIKVRTSYRVTITVTDAATGTVVGSSSVFAGATPKGV